MQSGASSPVEEDKTAYVETAGPLYLSCPSGPKRPKLSVGVGGVMSQQTLHDILKGFVEKRSEIFADREVLGHAHIPENIPHRDEEIRNIATTLAPALQGGKTSNMFVYGKTGTGKTATIRQVTKEIEKMGRDVKVLYINCKMKKVSDTEYRLLAELVREMGGEITATGLPTDEVYKRFHALIDSKKQTVILVLDEIDALVKKIGDDILYNLTRINQELSQAKVSIVGISNDISFTETLDPRVKSSLSEEEIVFNPYNALQLQDILRERGAKAFVDGAVTPGVVEKCSALAAQEHGDARRAIDLLRISGEVAEREGRDKIRPEDIDKAENKLDMDRIVTVIKAQPRQSQAVLAAMVRLSEKGGYLNTGDIFDLYEKICSSRGLKTLTQRRVSDLIAELDMLGVISSKVISKGRYGRTREIRLQLGGPVLEKAVAILKENYLLDGLTKFKP